MVPIDYQGSWHATDILKPGTILDVLLHHRRSVCWLDADCEIKQYPQLLIDPAGSFAAYNWSADPDNTSGMAYDPARLICSGGVLFFRYNAAAIELLLRWDAMCTDAGDSGSDPALNRAYCEFRPPVVPIWLPKSYNRMDHLWPQVDPVIQHEFRNRKHSRED
jgi:hypothetical protein